MSAKELSLEPMTAGMILDRSFRIYRQNFALMISLSALVNVPLLAVTVGIPLLQRINIVFACLAAFVGAITFFLGLLIVAPLVTGATTKAVGEIYLGNEITAMSALRFAWKHVLTLLLVQIVAGAVVIVGLILFIIPGIMWMLSYSVVAPITVLEKTAPTRDERRDETRMARRGRAIRQRSWMLVQGYRWKALGILVVVLIAQFLPSTSVFMFQAYGGDSTTSVAVSNLVSGIASLLTYPLNPIAFTLLYYDLRIRKEGFDLEMLSRDIANPEKA